MLYFLIVLPYLDLVKGILEVYEDLVKILLMLQVFLKQVGLPNILIMKVEKTYKYTFCCKEDITSDPSWVPNQRMWHYFPPFVFELGYLTN